MARDITLHLGFVSTPYMSDTIAAPMRSARTEEARKKRRSFKKTMTAEKVSGILESSYNIVNQFSEKYGEEIGEIIRDGVELSIIDILPGGDREYKPISNRMIQYMKPKTREIEKLFREFLDNEEAEGSGIPTKAAMLGVRRGRKRGGRRPSFVDTGIYRASFRAWADIK
jgi:hypothetical protein